jgi:hypothetical protein
MSNLQRVRGYVHYVLIILRGLETVEKMQVIEEAKAAAKPKPTIENVYMSHGTCYAPEDWE